MLESLHQRYPDAKLSLLMRKGNESLFQGHPYLAGLLVWDKSKAKTLRLLQLAGQIRKQRFDLVINIQRFFSTGLLTILSRAGETRGFAKNPLSFLFTRRFPHEIGEGGTHETVRNQGLIADLCGPEASLPRLYPRPQDEEVAKAFADSPYISIAPSSVWFTKQWPPERWANFISKLDPKLRVLLIGSQEDAAQADSIIRESGHPNAINICGKPGLLASAALMRGSLMNYVNDSAPLHLASAMNAPVTAVFCSTIPGFGFGPLSENSHLIEASPSPACRPCGLHGLKQCPEKHFRCAMDIDVSELLKTLPSAR